MKTFMSDKATMFDKNVVNSNIHPIYYMKKNVILILINKIPKITKNYIEEMLKLKHEK